MNRKDASDLVKEASGIITSKLSELGITKDSHKQEVEKYTKLLADIGKELLANTISNEDAERASRNLWESAKNKLIADGLKVEANAIDAIAEMVALILRKIIRI